ncbi:MAG: BglG family transcription antiterminator [Bacillus sp. (in: firmicutes)]
MDTYTFKILTNLLEEERYITYEYLSTKMGISLRTLKRNMKEVQNYLKKHNICLDVQRGKGICLNMNRDERERFRQELNQLSIGFIENEERCLYILCELFLEEDYLKIDYLSWKLQVAVGTIERNLKTVQKILEQEYLQLDKSRGKGLRITGSETRKRTAIVNLISRWIDTKNMDYYGGLNLTIDSFKDELIIKIREKLMELIDVNIIRQIDLFIDQYDKKLRVKFADEAYIKLILWLSLCVTRNSNRNQDDKTDEFDHSNLMDCIYIKIMDTYEISWFNEDMKYLTDYYHSSRKQNHQIEMSNLTADTKEKTEKILQNIENDLKIQFDRESEFVKQLVFHLNLFMERMKKNIRITNDFLDLIKKDYSDVYCSVEKSLANMETTIPEEEIGYISMHIVAVLLEMGNQKKRKRIAAVCMSGISSSKILVESIKRYFPEVDIVEQIGIGDFNEWKLMEKGVDMIVSTIKIETDFLPIVVLNPFFKEKDRNVFKKALEQLQDKPGKKENVQKVENDLNYAETEYRNIMNNLLEHFYFDDTVREKDIYGCIEVAARAFGKTEEDIRIIQEKFCEREKYKSTLIEDVGLALFHCRYGNIKKIGVMRLPHPAICPSEEGECLINAIFVMVMPEKENGKIKNVFSEISAGLITKESFLPTIMEGSKEEIKNQIRDIVERFIHQENRR